MATNTDTVQQINNSLGKIMAIRALISGKELTNSDTNLLEGIKVVQDFLDAPMNSSEESNFKKAFVASVLVSKVAGKIQVDGKYTTEEIAIAISEGLTRLKTQYLVGKGHCNGKTFTESMAEEIQLDHEIAALVMIVEKRIDNWCEQLPNDIEKLTDEHYEELVGSLNLAISAVIANYLSPELATQVSLWIDEFATKLKPEVLGLINKGAKIIVRIIKPKVLKIVQETAKAIQWIKNKITEKKKTIIKVNQLSSSYEEI